MKLKKKKNKLTFLNQYQAQLTNTNKVKLSSGILLYTSRCEKKNKLTFLNQYQAQLTNTNKVKLSSGCLLYTS
ncbi:hypothetical protein, partial [Enterococcus sp. 12E11_DIV0728]|uniref:hypothetical protein n=1 Tax=Enterococcus sp. 12E11_DIV0728 TaxID=1834168 RepID=UPI001C391B89